MAKSESDVINNGRDAMAWAKDFIEICPGAKDLDLMTVFGWFANAIEAQHFAKLEKEAQE